MDGIRRKSYPEMVRYRDRGGKVESEGVCGRFDS